MTKPVYLRATGLPSGAFRRIGSTDQRCTDDDLWAAWRVGGVLKQTVAGVLRFGRPLVPRQAFREALVLRYPGQPNHPQQAYVVNCAGS